MEYERENDLEIAPLERIRNFEEFHVPLSLEKQQVQGARCMACGVPFCQAGMMIGGHGLRLPAQQSGSGVQRSCIYTETGRKHTERLTKTHCFPEFTSQCLPGAVRSGLYVQSGYRAGCDKGERACHH